jgi:hypothetical protein
MGSLLNFYIGALATLVASYLARARGSNEPEVSVTRAKNLDQFIRECRAFQMDHGHVTGNEFDDDLIGFRHKFEELLGNPNGWVLVCIFEFPAQSLMTLISENENHHPFRSLHALRSLIVVFYRSLISEVNMFHLGPTVFRHSHFNYR